MFGDERWVVPGYTEVRELGSGASGRVVLATGDHDGTGVAIKYLSERLRDDVGFVARFRQEARLLSAMRSRHHARLIDYIESGRGSAIVMELVNGIPLRELLRSEGPTGPEAALTVLKGSLQGLADAHAMGIVHRDYKPENVIVEGDGATKLVDFGIAVTAGAGAEAAGTPPYMAPEQWSDEPATPATDVYAATVVFFECLTGARPYQATNLAALARQHLAAPPPVDQVPEGLQGLVERGLAKNPADRPESAQEFLIELETAARDAYGADWEERGRRRLAALAALLLTLWPVPPENPPAEAHTTLAETRFDGPARLLGKVPAKAVITTACVGVAITLAVVVVNPWKGDPELRAQATTSSPTPSLAIPEPTEIDELDPVEAEPSEEPEPTPEETTPQPSQTAAPVTPPTTGAPTARPSARPTVTPSRTRKPTPRPTRTSVRTPTRTPAETPPTRLSGKAGTGDRATTSTTPRQPSATPTREAPTRRPTAQPTRPPSTPPSTPSSTPTETPTDDETPPRPPTTPTVIID
ncbi:MAG TPA: protein kinase [Nonomuraea sp.]|nr:protein kinase [Nonomuraea sp.]